MRMSTSYDVGTVFKWSHRCPAFLFLGSVSSHVPTVRQTWTSRTHSVRSAIGRKFMASTLITGTQGPGLEYAL